MDVIFDRGLHLPSLDLWMDSHRARLGCWVSHGHADHIAPHKQFFATGPTSAFLRLRHGRSQSTVVEYGQPLVGLGYQVTLFPAGHCLGSAQVLIEVEDTGQRVVYTGDFKLRPNPTAEPASVIPCQTLIIEATFGHPRYVFPPEEETLDQLAGFVEGCFQRGETPVLLAYALGKAQEALHHLLARGYSVRYHPRVGDVVRLYQEMGVAFSGDHGCLEDGSAGEVVVLFPPGGRRGPLYYTLPRPRAAVLTGWALDEATRYRFHVDQALPLSDHADFSELMRYIHESGAREVYTVNGLPHLASHLRELGIAATHLEKVTAPLQLSLPLQAAGRAPVQAESRHPANYLHRR